MRWTCQIANDGSEMTVYDHNNTEVTTVTNNGGGLTVPDDVLDVMFTEAKAQYRMGNVKESLELVGMMAGEQIKVA